MVRKLIHRVTKVLVPIPIFFRRGKTWSVWIFWVYLRICTLFKTIQFLFLQVLETKTNHSLKGKRMVSEKKRGFIQMMKHNGEAGALCAMKMRHTVYAKKPNTLWHDTLCYSHPTQHNTVPNQTQHFKESCRFFSKLKMKRNESCL